MSFILDALRKSETERQRQATPGITDAPQRMQAPRRNRWVPLAVLLLAVNALLIAAWLLRSPPPPASKTVTLPAPPAPVDKSPSKLRELSETAAATPAAVAAARPSPAAEPAPAASPPPVERAPPPPAPAPAAAEPAKEALPSMQQLIVSGQLTLPPLHLDMHVYSDDPGQRFVFVNMRKYREGQKLEEGPILDSIMAEGVILSHQGNRFTLHRE